MKYAVFGCGSLGLNLAKRLQDLGREVVVIDRERAKVETMIDHGMEAVVGDIKDAASMGDILGDVQTIFIMTGINEEVLEGIKAIKEKWPAKRIIVRARDQSDTKVLSEYNVDHIFQIDRVLSDRIIRETIELEGAEKVNLLREILSGNGGEVAVFIHNNPDPDAIAAAYGMVAICQQLGREATIYYGGRIDHQENRALVNLLSIPLKKINNAEEAREVIKNASRVVFIDMSTPGSNNILPPSTVPNIILDHHPIEGKDIKADLMDIRESYGSTSTIMVEYLRKLEVPVDENLSSALLYGIRTDTAKYTRHVSDADFEATAYLVRYANMNIIQQLEYSPISIETLDILGRAIRNREVRGPYLITCVEFISERDALPQAADYLLRLEGINTTLVFGIVGDTLHISARSNDTRVNIGQVLQEAFGKEYAGGHQGAAAAQIPLGIFGIVEDKDSLIKLARAAITKQFFNAIGVDIEHGEQQEDEE